MFCNQNKRIRFIRRFCIKYGRFAGTRVLRTASTWVNFEGALLFTRYCIAGLGGSRFRNCPQLVWERGRRKHTVLCLKTELYMMCYAENRIASRPL